MKTQRKLTVTASLFLMAVIAIGGVALAFYMVGLLITDGLTTKRLLVLMVAIFLTWALARGVVRINKGYEDSKVRKKNRGFQYE